MFDDGNDPKGRHGLDDLDFKTARLDEMSHALRDLEYTKQGLLKEVRVLRSRLFEEKEDESDVYYFLHKKLDDNFDVICALERQLMVETADREKAETECIRRIEDLNHRRDEELEPLKEKLAALEKQVNSMRDAAESKRECDAVRTRLEEELQSTRSKIESDLSLERRRKLQEKQRVRRQVDVQIKELSTDLLWKKEAELADKSARATENNEKLRVALHAKAKQAERMMVRNQGLAFENTSLRNEVELAKASEVVLSKRVQAYHNLVAGLKVRLEQEADVDENERQALADLEESLAEGDAGRLDSACTGLNTPSLASDASGTEVAWTGGACGGVTCGKSVDQLHEAIESIRRRHEEFQNEARMTAERVEELEASATTGCRTSRGDLLTERLLETCQRWITSVQGSTKQISNGIPRDHPCENITRCGTTDDGRDLGDGSVSRAPNPCATPSQKRSKGVCQLRTWGQGNAMASGSRVEESTRYMKPPPGPLATAAGTDARRRDLFYALVDALRRHQDENRADTNDDGEAEGCGAECKPSDQTGDPTEPLCGDPRQLEPLESNACIRRLSDVVHPSATEVGCRRASSSATSCRTSRNGISSSSAVSFCDLPASEVRDASTQTIAKHFPEKFPSVPPARRLVVSNTFVTSGGALCSVSSSTSCGKGLGTWSRSALGELHRE